MNLNQFFKSVDGKDERIFTDAAGKINPAAKMNEFVGNVLWQAPSTNVDQSMKLFILAQKIYQWKDIKSIDAADIKLIKETIFNHPGISVGAKGQILEALDKK